MMSSEIKEGRSKQFSWNMYPIDLIFGVINLVKKCPNATTVSISALG